MRDGFNYGRAGEQGVRTERGTQLGVLTELLLPVEPEVADNDDELTDERSPEGNRRHWAALESVLEVPCRGIGEDTARTNAIRSGSSRSHDAYTPNELSKCKRGANVQA